MIVVTVASQRPERSRGATPSRASRGEHPHTHEHRDVSGGWLRPTVFGAMDGLVTNVSLIAGVGGGGLDSSRIILTGLAGLVAGAFSMATGEYTSVTSQNELVRAEVEVERRQLENYPEEEKEELAEAFAEKGVEPELAEQVAEQVSQDPEEALRLHAKEELGVDPEDLPSPVVAAVSSFFSFSVGAVIPLLSYLAGSTSLALALGISAIALFVAGGVVAKLTAVNVWYGATRQLLLAALAAGVTYAVGRAIGTSVS
jgi:VIT1/CCC1 family predicted Fe2+/Mn2+ transporter